MFCPICKAEYVEGITECADCHVPLVEKLPPEPEHEDIELVTILETSDAPKLAVAQSILEEAEIPFLVKGEGIQDLFGLGRINYNPVSRMAEIQVNKLDEKEARGLLKELVEDEEE